MSPWTTFTFCLNKINTFSGSKYPTKTWFDFENRMTGHRIAPWRGQAACLSPPRPSCPLLTAPPTSCSWCWSIPQRSSARRTRSCPRRCSSCWGTYHLRTTVGPSRHHPGHARSHTWFPCWAMIGGLRWTRHRYWSRTLRTHLDGVDLFHLSLPDAGCTRLKLAPAARPAKTLSELY